MRLKLHYWKIKHFSSILIKVLQFLNKHLILLTRNCNKNLLVNRCLLHLSLKKLGKKIERQFEKIEIKIEIQFKKMDKQVKKVENNIWDLKIYQEITLVITQNSCLTQFHQPIYPIKLFKLNLRSNMFIWISHPKIPKHMKSFYYLGQQTKRLLVPDCKKTIEQPNIFF